MRLAPTSIRLLVVLAVIAGATGWALFTLVLGQTGRVVAAPWLSAGTLWLLAGALALWAWTSRPRLLRLPGARPMPPLVAARTAALAMAASRTGALVTGGYLGLGLAAVSERSVPTGQQTMFVSFTSAAGAVALTAVALWLEHLCRLPQRDDDGRGLGG